MKYLRTWHLPTLDEPIVEHLDRIPQWGEHVFWYCSKCRYIYASYMVQAEDCSKRTWRGMAGLCLTCAPDRWNIRGAIDHSSLIRLEVPIEVLLYILDREIDFVGHPAHPHNEVVE